MDENQKTEQNTEVSSESNSEIPSISLNADKVVDEIPSISLEGKFECCLDYNACGDCIHWWRFFYYSFS